MLEHRTLGDSKTRSDIADPSRVITVLGEVLHSGLDNAAALGIGPWVPRRDRLVEWRRCAIAGDS